MDKSQSLTRMPSTSLRGSKEKALGTKLGLNLQSVTCQFLYISCCFYYYYFSIFFSYLQVEWKVRKKDSKPREFSKESIKGNHPKVGSIVFFFLIFKKDFVFLCFKWLLWYPASVGGRGVPYISSSLSWPKCARHDPFLFKLDLHAGEHIVGPDT